MTRPTPRTDRRAGVPAAVLFAAALTTVAVTTPAEALECDDPGEALPVVLVHGINGDPSTFDGFDDELDAYDELHVELFDYADHATEWVTHERIGPALADDLKCLGDRSLDNGGQGRVAVIGHSMGGLAARHALDHINPNLIAMVGTLGTPHQGSSWADGSTKPEATVLRRMLAHDQRTLASTFSWMDRVPGQDTPGVQGLAIGSEELDTLADFPPDIPVYAGAGDYVNERRLLYFVDLDDDRLGDLIVSETSATDQHQVYDRIGGTETHTCTVPVSLQPHEAALGPFYHAGRIAGSLTSACFHTELAYHEENTDPLRSQLLLAAERDPRDECDPQQLTDVFRTQAEAADDAHLEVFRCEDGWAGATIVEGADGAGSAALQMDDVGRWELAASSASYREFCRQLDRFDDVPDWLTTDCVTSNDQTNEQQQGSLVEAEYGGEPNESFGDDDAQGSGCTPGTDHLPDGIWFGHIVEFDASTVTFDLACLFTGQAALDRGVPEGAADIAIVNETDRWRTLEYADHTQFFLYPGYPTHGDELVGHPADDINQVRDTLRDRPHGEPTWREHENVWVLIVDGELVEVYESILGFVS